MIAKHIPMHSLAKSSFSGLVNYITDAQSKEHRLGEVNITNCAAHDLDFAVAEVLATQMKNTRAKSDKTFHLLVSFRPDEHPSAEVLQAIEEKICQGLGFGEHQRISAVHHDTDNLHIHIAINKIHPDRLTIHEPYYPYKTLAKLCARLEQEYGLQVDNHEPKRTVAEGRAMDMEAHSGIESLLGWIKRECLSEIKTADSWQALHQVMQDNGLELRVRANGLVFESKKTGIQVKGSSVSRDLSKSRLEARLGAFEAIKQVASEPLNPAAIPNQTQQAKKQYEKKPVRFGVDTTALYARYQAEQKRRSSVQKTALEALRKQKSKRIAQAKHSASVRRNVIKLMGGGRLSKKMLYAQASSALMGNIAGINAQHRQACQALYQDNSRATWADWLKQQAIKGDSEALSALRSRESAKGFNSRRLYGKAQPVSQRSQSQTPQRAAGTLGLGVLPKAANDAPLPIDNITKKGTVMYRIGTSHVRDNGSGVQIARTASPQAMQQALVFAAQRCGSELSISGDLLFKAQMVRAAASGKLPVTFADPLLERKRQELIKGTLSGQPNTPGQYRGRAGRIAARHGQSATAAQDARNATATRATPRAIQSDAGRFAAPPPPVARDRMHGLPQRTLAGLRTGIEMLLPPVVSVFLRQPAAESAALLRRSAASVKTRFSDVVERLKTNKAKEQTQEHQQEGGISL